MVASTLNGARRRPMRKKPQEGAGPHLISSMKQFSEWVIRENQDELSLLDSTAAWESNAAACKSYSSAMARSTRRVRSLTACSAMRLTFCAMLRSRFASAAAAPLSDDSSIDPNTIRGRHDHGSKGELILRGPPEE